MKCVILCAGYATRLYPLTLNTPKPLLEIKGKPLIDYAIEKIEELEEVDEIYIVTNDKFYNNFAYWLAKEGKNFSKKIEIIDDNTGTNETRLGGIGDLWFVKEEKNIDDDVLVVLGDNLFDFDMKDMVKSFDRIRKTTIAVYDIKDLEEAKKFGVIEVKDSKIVSISEKPQAPKTTLVSAGIYIFSRDDLEKIEEYMQTQKPKEGPAYLVIDLFSSQDVYAFPLTGRWFDIGSIETYSKVKEEW